MYVLLFTRNPVSDIAISFIFYSDAFGPTV